MLSKQRPEDAHRKREGTQSSGGLLHISSMARRRSGLTCRCMAPLLLIAGSLLWGSLLDWWHWRNRTGNTLAGVASSKSQRSQNHSLARYSRGENQRRLTKCKAGGFEHRSREKNSLYSDLLTHLFHRHSMVVPWEQGCALCHEAHSSINQKRSSKISVVKEGC